MNPKTVKLLELKKGCPHPLLVGLFNEAITHYKETSQGFEDPKYADMIRKDVSNLRKTCRCYAKGQFRQACSLIEQRDSAVRDVVPAVCWGQMDGMNLLLPAGRKARLQELRKLRENLS